MWAAAKGHSTLGIPTSVGEEFVRADANQQPPDLGDLNDFEAAEAVRDNELPSPTKYGDFWLFDLRITGTGHAYRDSIDEWAIRDPVTWTSQEFVDRCNGLPVIFEHPERSGLNEQEFRDRAIGTIVMPYVKDDEVWGIAKIFDGDAAQLMQTTHRSTSPGVTPPKGADATNLKDGTKVLAEGLPLTLDHLAVCENGVWDKDGPPVGIRLDRKDSVVTEEEKKALEKERDDAKVRADSAESELKEIKDKARKDAEETEKKAIEAAEKEKADAAKKDRAKRHDCDRMDGESDEMWDARKKDARKDASEEEKKELEARDKEREDKRKDAAAKEAIDADRGTDIHDAKVLRAKVDTLESQIAALSRPPSIEDTDSIAKAFHRADHVFQALGEQTPPAMPGERPIAYRKRLVARLKQFTDSWQNYVFHDAQQTQDFDLVERAIYGEAEAHSKKAFEGKPGFLREIVDTTSMPGKRRVSFVGDSRAAWLPFMQPVQTFVTGFNTDRSRAASR